jgi:hypothetical protein
MKKRRVSFTVVGAILLCTLGFINESFAVEPANGDCEPNTTFWGERCCRVVVLEDDGPGYIHQTCCKYRVFINVGCSEEDLSL